MSTKFCQVCAQPVSLKIWTAHVKGRKHLQKVQEAKSKGQKPVTSSHAAATGSKHPLPVPDSDLVSAKRARVETTATESASSKSADVNELSFIPSGFFDDAAQNNKTDAEVAKQKLLDAEYAKFMNEVASAEAEVAIEDEGDVKTFTHERQMESIDATIKYWQAFNELEKRKEALAEKKHVPDGDVDVDMEDAQAADNDDSSDDDLDGTNWRKRTMF
uniref:Zinc finger protein 830 n=1 Tax=Panagrellus redivivus TaxID=6233 RepID=A0A7E4VV68_PANRE